MAAPTPPKHLIVLAVILGITARLTTASAGDNYDMESWWIASEAVLRHEPVYAATHRYNYGPIWSFIIGGIRWLSAATGPDTVTRLHLLMTTFLTLADLFLAWTLTRSVSWFAALLFFLNPISCFVTGYHIQFDNLAIALGIASWIVFTGSRSTATLLVAATLMGASLTMKHIFSLFIVWLPFAFQIRNLRERMTYGALSLLIFFGSFLPWSREPAVWESITRNVFAYTSTEGHSLTGALASLVHTPARPTFLFLTMVTGVLLLRARALHRFAPHLYLIALPALSSGMARNYLAIPLVGICTFLWAPAGPLYIVVASLAFICTNEGLGVREVAIDLIPGTFVTYELCQVLLLLTLAQVYRRARADTT